MTKKLPTTWVCDRCGVSEDTPGERPEPHMKHPRGWRREGNTHPELDRFDPDHPDVEKGFMWTVRWEGKAAGSQKAESG